LSENQGVENVYGARQKINNQKKNKKAEIILKNNNLSYYAWPQTFSSSAGPYKGNIVGCNAFTTITVEAYVEPLTKKLKELNNENC
jgi:hypothetical protein